ncbi:MAG: NTP transferase domain-containing protein [Chloroflexi bacterium]|nr:NTP transferase domain-containing protein [Chloroflexota bacterium]
MVRESLNPGCDQVEGRPLKVVILAAGQRAGVPYPRALQRLGDRALIDYVLSWARALAAPDHIYVIVGRQHEAIEEHLGPAYHYVLQEEARGTGHAVMQVYPLLRDFAGDLFILYGDTPLFRLASLRGMLLRHRLKGADLTLFSRVTSQSLPYGRIVRDKTGRIVDLVEQADASAEIRSIRELNLGAYVARARPLFEALREIDRGHSGADLPLTAAIRQLVRCGYCVETYQSADEDEVLGINTPEDLEAAELILQKRILRPRRVEEENIISFGTGGWRAVIGEGFTLHNVRRLCQALANRLIRMGRERQGVLIGYDRRFLSDRAAEAAVEVFAGNNVCAALLAEPTPTPLITFATVRERAAYGLAFTASHNPPEWNGLKVFKEDGSLLLDDESRAIEAEANRLSADEIIKVELPLALASPCVRVRDYTNEYVDAVESFVDMEAIREAGLRVLVDPMFGVGEVTIDIVLTEARCRVSTIHGRRDPLFGGRSPAPDLEALGLLIHEIREGSFDLGLATDGDADRIAIVDEKGRYISANELLVLLYWYLHEVRGERGPVVRNLATTHMLDRLARELGEQCIEVPVGFKHIAAAMQTHNAVLGGESSGGLTIRGHILGKDGILAAALIVEMLAKTREKVSVLLERIYARIGRLYVVERNLPATPEMKALFPRLLRRTEIREIAGYPVIGLSTLDGTKLFLPDDQWVLLRFSGTEPLLRIFAEADAPEKAQALVEAAQKLLPM